jgi:molybdopterin-guanine dinucleotide biosynthesis protein
MIGADGNQSTAMRYFPGRFSFSRAFLMNTRIIVIAGTSSNSGKTSLLCDLLRKLSQTATWEAIKLTRGHYSSCGKDPHACCVSHLLSDQPTVRSGREATYATGKDTGRYWDSGAVNVHWVIATDSQVEAGIQEALSRVIAPNILIEGTSVLSVIPVDFAILAVGDDLSKTKASVRRALLEQKINALYFHLNSAKQERLLVDLQKISPAIDSEWLAKLPVFTPDEIPRLAQACATGKSPVPIAQGAKRS